MYKIGICGHFGEKHNLLNGQTIKTKTLSNELKSILGADLVYTIDTYNWKLRPISLLIKCFLLIKNSDNIIILPAHNGVKIFSPLFVMINKLFHKRLHYVVIGGWLPMLLKENSILLIYLKKFHAIYVETNIMAKSLNDLGLNNVKVMPNFKKLDILNEDELIYNTIEPLKLCTFSRVMQEKGIEDAINAVNDVNTRLGRIAFKLDIFGKVEDEYNERFDKLKMNFPEYITYKGIVNFNDSVKVLKNYFALLFPTYYEGEGFAGTIIDAYAAGLPVVATNWKYNSEIIRNKIDGLIFDYEELDNLVNILMQIQKNPDLILSMKKECLERAKEFIPDNVIKIILNNLY